MDFTEKISQIEKLLPNRTRKEIKNRTVLACGIYYHLKLKVPFRKLPPSIYNWSSIRNWIQKLRKTGKLQEIESIIEK